MSKYPSRINSEHFFIESSCGKIGAWFLHPEEDKKDKYKKVSSEQCLVCPCRNHNCQVILYLHGIKGTRGRQHRLELYKVLLSEGFSILTIDYRGFGDSTDTSETEDSVVEDAKTALSWLRQSERLEAADRLIVWGHSMGSGVATRAVAEDPLRVDGLILEAPYNNFTEEMIHFTTNTSCSLANSALSHLYSYSGQALPNTLLAFFKMEFNSDTWIAKIRCPILILHAKGDLVIPISLGRKLYQAAVESGNKVVKFHEFDDSYNHRESLQ